MRSNQENDTHYSALITRINFGLPYVVDGWTIAERCPAS